MFNANVVLNMLHRHKTGQEDCAHRIWALLTLELWMREFIDKHMRIPSSLAG
jgi:hypothetical protein